MTRKFYQKLTDIHATSLDHDRAAAATQRFFARLFESDFDRVVAETKQLASNGPSASPPKPRKGKKS